jgi:hypothetical protein
MWGIIVIIILIFFFTLYVSNNIASIPRFINDTKKAVNDHKEGMYVDVPGLSASGSPRDVPISGMHAGELGFHDESEAPYPFQVRYGMGGMGSPLEALNYLHHRDGPLLNNGNNNGYSRWWDNHELPGNWHSVYLEPYPYFGLPWGNKSATNLNNDAITYCGTLVDPNMRDDCEKKYKSDYGNKI